MEGKGAAGRSGGSEWSSDAFIGLRRFPLASSLALFVSVVAQRDLSRLATSDARRELWSVTSLDDHVVSPQN